MKNRNRACGGATETSRRHVSNIQCILPIRRLRSCEKYSHCTLEVKVAVGKNARKTPQSLISIYVATTCDWIYEDRLNLKYSRHCGSLMLDCSHARFAPEVD